MSTTKAWRCDRCYPGYVWDNKADLLCGRPSACKEREVYVVPVTEAQAYEPGISGVSDHLVIPVPEEAS